MSVRDDPALEVRRLQGRVEALERILVRRSLELQRVTSLLPARELASLVLRSTQAGSAGISEYYELAWFDDSPGFVRRDVEPTMRALWETAPQRPLEGRDEP